MRLEVQHLLARAEPLGLLKILGRLVQLVGQSGVFFLAFARSCQSKIAWHFEWGCRLTDSGRRSARPRGEPKKQRKWTPPGSAYGAVASRVSPLPARSLTCARDNYNIS
jgi:hypothetical protein